MLPPPMIVSQFPPDLVETSAVTESEDCVPVTVSV
jgi:hypothetical protein